MTSHLSLSETDLLADSVNFLSDEPDLNDSSSSLVSLWAAMLGSVGGQGSSSALSVPAMMAATWNALEPGVNASHLTMGEGELLAGIVNALNGDSAASHLSNSVSELYSLLRDASEEGGAGQLAPGAPTINLRADSDLGLPNDNLTSDTSPGFTIVFATPPLTGDLVTPYKDLVAQSAHVITPDEEGGGDIDLDLSPFIAGTYDITFTHSRGGAESDQSNEITLQIKTAAPTISVLSPLDNAVDVAVGGDLVVTFSEPVFLGSSGVITLKKTADNSTLDSWDVATDEGGGAGQLQVLNDDELHLKLTGNLPDTTEVYVIWDAGVVENDAGVLVAALASTTDWSFTTGTSGALYEGPGDAVAGAIHWYGLRAFSAAAIGGNVIRLKRDSDNATQDFVSQLDGGLDLAAIASFKGAATLTVDILYDQVGSADLDFSGAAYPLFELGVINGLPVVRGNAASNRHIQNRPAFNPFTVIAQPLTISAVGTTSATVNVQAYLDPNTGCTLYDNTSGDIGQFAGSFATSPGVNGTRSLQAIFNGASSHVYQNGVAGSNVNPGAGSTSTTVKILNAFGGGGSGDWMEAGIWDFAFDSTQAGDMTTNQSDYYGL